MIRIINDRSIKDHCDFHTVIEIGSMMNDGSNDLTIALQYDTQSIELCFIFDSSFYNLQLNIVQCHLCTSLSYHMLQSQLLVTANYN